MHVYIVQTNTTLFNTVFVLFTYDMFRPLFDHHEAEIAVYIKKYTEADK